MATRMMSLALSDKPPARLSVFLAMFAASLHEFHVRKLGRNFIDDDQQNNVHGSIEKAHSGGIAVLGVFNTLLVHIHRNHIAGCFVQVGLQQPHLLKAHIHQAAGCHDEVQHRHGQQRGKVDVHNPLEHGSAVHFGRFIQAGIHVCQCRQIDDAAPARVLPDAGSDVDRSERGGLCQKVGAGAQNQVQQAAGGAEKDADHAAHDHDGDKVRGIQHGLHHSLISLEPKLVDDQRKDDGNGEAPQQGVQADQHGVADHAAAGGGAEKPLEPFQAHPCAS